MAQTCRVCLEENPTVILPCQCKGDMGALHEQCFREWWQFLRACTPAPLTCDVCCTQLPTLHFYNLLMLLIRMVAVYFATFTILIPFMFSNRTDIHLLWVVSHLGWSSFFCVMHFRVGQRIVLLNPVVTGVE